MDRLPGRSSYGMSLAGLEGQLQAGPPATGMGQSPRQLAGFTRTSRFDPLAVEVIRSHAFGQRLGFTVCRGTLSPWHGLQHDAALFQPHASEAAPQSHGR